MCRIPIIVEGLNKLAAPPLRFPARSDWFFDEMMKVYLRAGAYSVLGKSGNYITIANIDVYEDFRRQGLMRELFDSVERLADSREDVDGVICESVLEPEVLRQFLIDRGYESIRHTDPNGTGMGNYVRRTKISPA